MAYRQEDVDAMMEELSPNKLGKRLAYILRYGAVKEGLEVSGEGEDISF